MDNYEFSSLTDATTIDDWEDITFIRKLGKGIECIAYLCKDRADAYFVARIPIDLYSKVLLQYDKLGRSPHYKWTPGHDPVANKAGRIRQTYSVWKMFTDSGCKSIHKTIGMKDMFVLTEYCNGGTLRDLLPFDENALNFVKFSKEEVRFIMMKLLLALQKIHKSGFVHLDPRPDNIFVNGKGDFLLSDMGSVTEMDENVAPGVDSEQNPYIAPVEQRMKNKHSSGVEVPCANYADDLWMAGMIFAQLLKGWTHGELCNYWNSGYHMESFLSTASIGISAEAKDLLGYLLHPDPSKKHRYRLEYPELFSHEFFTENDSEYAAKVSKGDITCPPSLLERIVFRNPTQAADPDDADPLEVPAHEIALDLLKEYYSSQNSKTLSSPEIIRETYEGYKKRSNVLVRQAAAKLDADGLRDDRSEIDKLREKTRKSEEAAKKAREELHKDLFRYGCIGVVALIGYIIWRCTKSGDESDEAFPGPVNKVPVQQEDLEAGKDQVVVEDNDQSASNSEASDL